jgi:hypothetical protein
MLGQPPGLTTLRELTQQGEFLQEVAGESAAAVLPGPDRYEVVAWCAGRLPASQQLDLLFQAGQHISDTSGEPWGGVTASALAGWLTDTLARPDAIPVLPAEAVSLLRALGAGRTEGWGNWPSACSTRAA